MKTEVAKAIEELFTSSKEALAWLENMVPTKSRKALADKLKHALNEAEPVRIVAEGVLRRNEGADSDCA